MNNLERVVHEIRTYSRRTASPYIRWANTIEAECERIRNERDAQYEVNTSMIARIAALEEALAESRANDRTAMSYLSQVREVVGGEDFLDMVRRVEKYRNRVDHLLGILQRIQDTKVFLGVILQDIIEEELKDQ